MIRLTVLYNLPDGADEEEFLKWRLTEHQQNNESMPGVIRTAFSRVVDTWPKGSMPEYRFQTVVEWPNRTSFDAGFGDDTVQEKLKNDLQRLGEYSFFVSEVMIDSDTSRSSE